MTKIHNKSYRLLACSRRASSLSHTCGLPAISRTALAVKNAISRSLTGKSTVACGGYEVVMSQACELPEQAAFYRFRLGRQTGLLGFDAELERFALGDNPVELPQSLRQALLLDRFEAVVDALEAWTGGHFMLLDTPEPATAPSFVDPTALHLALSQNKRQWNLTFLFDSQDALQGILKRIPDGEYSLRWDGVPFGIRFEIGHTLLQIKQVEKLKEGDVVVVQNFPGDGHKRSLVGRISGLHSLVIYANDNQQFIEVESIQDHPTGMYMSSPHTSISVDSLDKLQVSLRVEIAEISIPFGELRKIGPGQLLELDQPLSNSRVKLYVNDAFLGQGDLIAVGDQLGVRIGELNALKQGDAELA